MADDVAGQFKGLPMGELIGAPLTAACDAQLRLADASLRFINQIAYKDGTGASQETRLIEFDLDRPTETPTGYGTFKTHVQAPFIGLVPLPALLIEDVNIEFQMEVSATEQVKTTDTKEASVTASAGFKFGAFNASVQVQGKVASSRENTRSTNQTAKYQVRVSARQQQPTEGLARLMDIMAQCTAPLEPKAST
jgi:hypothetical protein